MNGRERVTRAIERRSPDRIPARVSCSAALWKTHRDELREVYERVGWPSDWGYDPPGKLPVPDSYDDFADGYREGEVYVDNWGSVWHNIHGGLEGQVKGYPLADWSALKSYRAPDPTLYNERGGPIDWESIRQSIAASGHQRYVNGSGDRLWERLHFLRGMERLMIDVAEERPEVQELIDVVVDHNVRKIRKWLELDVDGISFGDDWGTQRQLMVSPRAWRKYFKPAYAREFAVVKAAGKHTYLHSDGCIHEVIPDLIEIGLDVVNPQIGANGLENLVRVCQGRICVDLDLNRQQQLAFGTPAEVREHVREGIRALAGDDGGLMLKVEFNPPAPVANVEAACLAIRELGGYPLRA